jgi:hypothetical protein
MFFFFLGAAQNNCINGNFQEKRISADSDYGQQSSGKFTIDFIDSYYYCVIVKKK